MAPSIPLGQTYELQSRKYLEEDIMVSLREKNVSVMGICGMGGVGKTTMAKKLMSRARGENLFSEILMVVVSQQVDMLRIQKEMAELLSLNLDVESVPARAHLLRTRLMNSKSILIILDDLWEKLNLEDLGIPDQMELKECTIILEHLQSSRISFPKLELLVLHYLPRLTSFSRGIQSIEFPLLTAIQIEECPNLKNLVSSTGSDDDDDSLHFFCKSKIITNTSAC